MHQTALHHGPQMHLDGAVLDIARDLGARNAELLPFFPGRTYYRAFRDVNGAVVIEPLLLLKKKDTHATGESGYDGQ